MQSQGSTSSQPSFDSLSSSDSLLFSDSEQAEDDTDVFLTDSSSSVIIGGVGGAAANRDRGSESPGSQWTCDGFTDKEEEEESYRSESGGKDERDPRNQVPKSAGDILFAQKVRKAQKSRDDRACVCRGKPSRLIQTARPNPNSVVIYLPLLFLCQCAELQGFVRPLLELLNGLKRGRFDRGKHPCITPFNLSIFAAQVVDAEHRSIWSEWPRSIAVECCFVQQSVLCQPIDAVQSAACDSSAHESFPIRQSESGVCTREWEAVYTCMRFPWLWSLRVQIVTGLLCFWSTGLSSFQQSVAMDRIQRIVGVLQRPNSG